MSQRVLKEAAAHDDKCVDNMMETTVKIVQKSFHVY